MRFFLTFKKDIDKLINPDQSGYIKECFIGTNARLIVKLCDYQEKPMNQESSYLLSFRRRLILLKGSFYSLNEEIQFQRQFC